MMDKTDRKQTQPEALAKFGEAARDMDGKPDKPGLRPKEDNRVMPGQDEYWDNAICGKTL